LIPSATLQSNWLPTPAGAAFNMTLRLYFPDETVLKGLYTPPTVTSPAAAQLLSDDLARMRLWRMIWTRRAA